MIFQKLTAENQQASRFRKQSHFESSKNTSQQVHLSPLHVGKCRIHPVSHVHKNKQVMIFSISPCAAMWRAPNVLTIAGDVYCYYRYNSLLSSVAVPHWWRASPRPCIHVTVHVCVCQRSEDRGERREEGRGVG